MHSNKNNNELKKYTQGLRKFKLTIPKNVKKIINQKGNLFYDILEKWDYLVGNKISSISYPKSIKLNKGENSNTLRLAVSRGDEITIEYSKREPHPPRRHGMGSADPGQPSLQVPPA